MKEAKGGTSLNGWGSQAYKAVTHKTSQIFWLSFYIFPLDQPTHSGFPRFSLPFRCIDFWQAVSRGMSANAEF